VDGDDLSGSLDLASDYTARFDGVTSSEKLRWVIPGDLDGDSVPDVIAGYVYHSYLDGIGYDFFSGGIAVYGGGALAGTYDLDTADDVVSGDDAYDYLGSSLASADVDGDGYDDVIAGAPGNDDAASDAGAVYVFPGGASGWSDDRAGGAASVVIRGTSASEALGDDPLPTPGDLDGRGGADLAIGAAGEGSVWVFFDVGSLSGTLSTSAADASWSGTGNFGSALATASDLDDDGADDLVIGASGDDTSATDAGAVFVFNGGTGWTTGMTSADADATIYGASHYDGLGSGLAAGGDVDADGHDDLLMGAEGSDSMAAGGGAVYLVLGR
jgi:hypothetical protein